LTEHILPPPTTKRPPSPWAMLASALLNILFIAVLLYINLVWLKDVARQREQAQQVEVELMPPPPPPAPKAEAPKPPPAEKQPEKPAEKPPEPQPEKQPQLVPKPPPPQLQAAPLREKSATPQKEARSGAAGDNASAMLLPGAGPLLHMHNKNEGKMGREADGGPIGEELSQSEQDFVLSQILPYWHVDTHRPEGKGMVLEAIIEIQQDGTLMSPLNRDDAWNPGAVIEGYAQLARMGYSYRREALEGFLLALRLSQPLKLPGRGPWPKWMKLRFAFDDM
jgi:hypothetical protein